MLQLHQMSLTGSVSLILTHPLALAVWQLTSSFSWLPSVSLNTNWGAGQILSMSEVLQLLFLAEESLPSAFPVRQTLSNINAMRILTLVPLTR